MSYHNNNAMGSGSRGGRRTVEFGRTYVVRPKGRHQATFVWLHGLGDNGSSWAQLLESLPLPNVKWICPTVSTRPVKLLGGFSCNAWFDAGELPEDGPEDMEGLDASAMHVMNLLSVKLGIGGFSMGASIALYSTVCWSVGKFANGIPYPVNLRAVIGLSGWLPCSRVQGTRSRHQMKGQEELHPCLFCSVMELATRKFHITMERSRLATWVPQDSVTPHSNHMTVSAIIPFLVRWGTSATGLLPGWGLKGSSNRDFTIFRKIRLTDGNSICN